MYALRQHAQHLFALLLTLACPGFLTVADIKDNVGATREHPPQSWKMIYWQDSSVNRQLLTVSRDWKRILF
jgi:hypothetical protein